MPQFVAKFSKKRIAVYLYLSNLPWMHEFPVEPNDNLNRIYGVSDEELADAYEAIMARVGRSLPNSRRDDAFKVETVEELVQFIADLPSK